ncbi:serine hydrolase domain-containing protein [Mucilaginibacter gracilis]|nr:serine hydrolase domain-containing protein [Mucilaginibacter gracilis]
MDSMFRATAAQGLLNGNVLVAQEGKIIYQQSFGLADFEQKKLHDPSTSFQLASLSKVFTAIAVLQQYEKGKLQLDDAYSKYFPSFPYKDIAIRGLLSHSSGLSDQDLDGAFADFEKKNHREPNNRDLLPVIAAANVKMKLSPGQKWWYCNLGYELLANLVEKVSGTTFAQYLEKNILGPAGMNDTYLKLPETAARAATANNYDYASRYAPEKIRVNYTEEAFGHSNLYSTTGDLFRLDQALYGNRLLKPATLAIAFSPDKWKDGSDNLVWTNIGGMGQALDGLGWFIFKDQSMGKTVWHAGGMQGAVTILLRDIGRKQTVILLDNAGSEGLYKTALNALKTLNGQPLLPVKKNLSKIYGREMMKDGMDHAMALLLQLKADTAGYNLNEDDMNNLGYAMLAGKQQAQALETLKVNCLLYPESDNVYNSYGEALAKAGRKEDAIAMYRRSLAINPKNEDSQQALQALLK